MFLHNGSGQSSVYCLQGLASGNGSVTTASLPTPTNKGGPDSAVTQSGAMTTESICDQ